MIRTAFLVAITLSAAAQPERCAVLLELDPPPAAAIHAAHAAAKSSPQDTADAVRKHIAGIEQAQRQLLRTLAAKDRSLKVLFQTQRVYNGIALRITAAQRSALDDLPGLRAVRPLRTQRINTDTTIPFLDIPLLWDGAGQGLTGHAVSIGIIDTGIDYLHPDFGGSGSTALYAANDPKILGDVPFLSPKIAGGYDFVGDDYDPEDKNNDTPLPDPDPMDKLGHGSHVAGIAAGYGVDPNGQTYAAGYGPLTPFQSMQIGPGSAPEAQLYALKVFGATGTSDILIPAIEWAIDPNADGDFSDRLDVINLSLGDAFGAADNPESVACDNAARAGIIVVASAGNSRDAYFISGTPAAAPWAISVAASEDNDPSVARLAPDRLAYFSSRGPTGTGNGALLLKPDLAAPGVSILSAAAYAISPNQWARLNSGTSMAAPHIAGIMALLRQQRPAWTVPELKALVMNSAGFDLFQGPNYTPPRYGPQRAGAGRADPAAAANSNVIAFDPEHPERVSLTFETTEVAGTLLETRNIRIHNKSPDTAQYAASLDFTASIPGATLEISPKNTGPIPPGAFADLSLTLNANANALKHSRDPAADPLYGENTRAWISELAGYVTLNPENESPSLRVPFYAALRPVANLAPQIPFFDARPGGNTHLSLSGDSLSGQNPPYDPIALAGAYELLYVSPDEPDSQGIDNAADIQFIAITSDYPQRRANGEGLQETTLFLAIAAHGPWFSPHWVQFLCYIDAGNDGRTDFGLYNGFVRANLAAEGPNPDVFAAILTDFHNNKSVQGFLNLHPPGAYDSVPFQTNILVLPLRVADLNLPENVSTVAFRCESLLYADLLHVIDEAPRSTPGAPRPMLLYDIARPGLTFNRPGGRVVFEAPDGAEILITHDPQAYAAQHGLGILLFQHHNPAGQHAQWIPVITEGDSDDDGIPDATEGTADNDNDAIPNLVDSDADGDAIPDATEGTADNDNDAIPNFLDLDADGDGISDALEATNDPDNDAIPNFLDLDADGDNILDKDEGTNDPDLDSIPNFLDLDADGDGLPDTHEGTDDPDNDAIPNFLDCDSDADGLPDRIEAIHATNPYHQDSDNDGIPDIRDGLGDDDRDTLVNAIDQDSDNDGLLDLWEGIADPDGDGLPNFRDPDSDGDGLDDRMEGLRDPDRDNIPNYLDLDSDNDTLADQRESTLFQTNPYASDTDADGIADNLEIQHQTDPRRAQIPPAPENLRASDGLFPDRVHLEWDPLPGFVEYQVFRHTQNNPENAQPLHASPLLAPSCADYSAAPPQKIPGRGCQGPRYTPVHYYYWVRARTVPRNGPPPPPPPPPHPPSPDPSANPTPATAENNPPKSTPARRTICIPPPSRPLPACFA